MPGRGVARGRGRGGRTQPPRAKVPEKSATSAAVSLARRVEAAGVAQIELQFADITGAVKNVSIPARRLDDVLRHGEWFDGSSMEGAAREVESDMYLVPDAATFAVIDPSAEVVCGRLICDVVTPDGKPYQGDSRSILRAIIAEAESGGLSYLVAPELEFFLFPADGGAPRILTDDPGSYFERSTGMGRQVELEIVAALEATGVAIESSHHEVGSGQYELDLPMQPALAAADALTTLKPAVKQLARERGLLASFMPKPLFGAAGSGMHTHQVLLSDGRNAFWDKSDPYGLSAGGRHFTAGQLEHAPGMSAVVAPLVNSYKRLVFGYEAPVGGSWARHNRSALIRIPTPPGGETGPRHPGTRLELRLPDPSCNAYLAFTVMLAAGLDGLERQLQLGPPMEEVEHGYQAGKQTALPLPGSLFEALQALEADDVLVDALGGEVLRLFRSAKSLEWDEYRRQVTQWELDTYLQAY